MYACSHYCPGKTARIITRGITIIEMDIQVKMFKITA